MSAEPRGADLAVDEERALARVLDELVPPDARRGLPGAGELGLGAALLERAPELRPALAQALAGLAQEAREAGAGGIEALPPDLVRGLAFHTCLLYYHHPRVLEALGLEPRPPWPGGYDLEPGDLTRLDAVRRRGKLYRDC